MEKNKNCRVVLFPQPYVGHLTPMLHLGNALHSKGFSISVIQTRFNAPDPTEFPNFTYHYIDDTLSKAQAPTMQMLFLLNASCLAPFRDCLCRILEDASKDREAVGCLIADPLWEFAATVAEEFNLPRLAIRTGGVLAFILYDSLPILRQNGYYPLQEARQEEPVQEVPPLKVKDLPLEDHHELMCGIIKETKNCRQGVICNTFKELEGSGLSKLQQCLPSIPIFTVGPLHNYSPESMMNAAKQDESPIAWLDTQTPNSVLYVSFGTVAVISKEQFLEVAWGLANSKHPFLWAVRPCSITGTEERNVSFPDDLLEMVAGRGRLVAWAPQQQVLAHPAVGGFLTHSGWNSTMESICEGVPMLCLPLFGDQKMNARHICEGLKIGLLLEKGFEREEIRSTIRKLMAHQEGEEMRERVAALEEKANHCLMEGGSSYESLDQLTNHILSFCPAEDMKDSS